MERPDPNLKREEEAREPKTVWEWRRERKGRNGGGGFGAKKKGFTSSELGRQDEVKDWIGLDWNSTCTLELESVCCCKMRSLSQPAW